MQVGFCVDSKVVKFLIIMSYIDIDCLSFQAQWSQALLLKKISPIAKCSANFTILGGRYVHCFICQLLHDVH